MSYVAPIIKCINNRFNRMSKNLVIVESPAKAKTINKYLGKDFKVLASYGHVRDLLAKEGSVDTEHDFAMRYELIEKNARHVSEIQKAMKKADTLLLAPDPDREGEAIAWHVYEVLRTKGALKDKDVKRVVFHEITKKAIQHAVGNPREISMDLVNAQQARRALDFLVGFNLSPLLWKKIRRGLSAGRVQSPALRMIVERELDIEKFVKQEYWTITADCLKKQPFVAKLNLLDGEKQEQFSITTEEAATKAQAMLEKAAGGKLVVGKVEKKQRKRNPSPPFITSTLQQEAARKLGFSAKKTMSIAQRLYEGVDIDEGTVGLITYMRTDSVNIAKEAVDEMREFIAKKYGKDSVPKDPRTFKTKAKNAQEAHEAIRPTSVMREPEQMKSYLEKDQYKLYQLVWKRSVACQMIHATIDTVSADLVCGSDKHIFRANGSTVAKPGFLAVYEEGLDDGKKSDNDEKMLPPLQEGDDVNLKAINTLQHFTEPPPRYSEASLVKALEEKGIGRPSTYATIISTLQNREYVDLEAKRFHPTDVGRVVARFLNNYFQQYVDYDFTAKLEDSLDHVADGDENWVELMRSFWDPFHSLVGKIDNDVERKDVTQEVLDEDCPKCGKHKLTRRLGRSGLFDGCAGYPDCDFTRDVGGDGESHNEVVKDRPCPKCDSELVIRHGKYGKFIGCSNYPKCKFIEPLEKPKDTGVTCPKCNKNTLLMKKSKRGKIFYGCAGYPKCDYALWNEPVNEKCPDCDWPLLTIKTTKRAGTEKLCPQDSCSYKVPLDSSDDSQSDS